MPEVLIEIKDVSRSYTENKHTVKGLDGISFNVYPREIVSILGPSGCGKTTLLNIISGIDNDYTGDIIGRPNSISYLFQEDRLLPYFNTLDNVTFTLPESYDKIKKNEIGIKYLNALDLKNEHNTYPQQLSGGMARRVAIARSLAYPASLLLLDEPFNGLNIELKYKVADMISDSIKSNDKTVILVSHDITILKYLEQVNIINLNK